MGVWSTCQFIQFQDIFYSSILFHRSNISSVIEINFVLLNVMPNEFREKHFNYHLISRSTINSTVCNYITSLMWQNVPRYSAEA